MKKATIFGLFALVIAGMIFSTGIASAYRGDYSVKGPDYTVERHELMENAFESLDYDQWKALMTESGRNPRVVDVVTQSNFEKFVLAHESAENGDLETAAELRAELGLNNGVGPKDGSGHGMGQGRMQRNNIEHSDGSGSGQGRGRR